MFLVPKFCYIVSNRVDQCNGLHIAQCVAAVTAASVSAMVSTSKSAFTSVSVSLTFLAFNPSSLSTSVLTSASASTSPSVLSTFLAFHEDPHAICFGDQRDFLVATDALFSKGDQRITCCGNLISKWWRVNLGNNFTFFAWRLRKLLGFGQNASEIIP